jgi:hypothetical protein
MLSIIVPGIRTHLWQRFITSVDKSCKEMPHEVVFISPFDLPELQTTSEVKHIKSYSSVPVCLQIGTLAAKYPVICHAVDDSVFHKETLSHSYDYFIMSNYDVVGLTYQENTNLMSAEKWKIKNISEFNNIPLDGEWITFVQPMMDKSRFINMGGFDCSFEYSNHCHHDLAFRMWMMGFNIDVVPFTVSYASHMPERTGDHAAIHDAQTGPDEKRFRDKWKEPNTVDLVIDYNNYRQYDVPWIRRFKKEYSSYEEMVKDQ